MAIAKRLIKSGLTCFILSIAVAICLSVAYGSTSFSGVEYHDIYRGWRWISSHRVGARKIKVDPVAESIYAVPGASAMTVVHEMPLYCGVDALPASQIPSWALPQFVDRATKTDAINAVYWRSEGYGWPFVCVAQQWVVYDVMKPSVLVGGIRIDTPNSIGFYTGSEKGIPFRPIWRGVALNIGTYMVIYFGLRSIIQILKNRASSSRHVCRICGYDVRGSRSRCPECGSPHT